MRNNILSITILLFLAIGFSACEKNTIWVYYDETHCSDKWGVAKVPDEEKIKKIKEHLRSQQIHVIKVEINSDGRLEVTCRACHCETGVIIKCKINERDLFKATNENFYK